MDASEILNPKKTTLRRLEAAEGHSAAPPTAAWKAEEKREPEHAGTAPFTKQWTAQERAEHQSALVRMLRGRR